MSDDTTPATFAAGEIQLPGDRSIQLPEGGELSANEQTLLEALSDAQRQLEIVTTRRDELAALVEASKLTIMGLGHLAVRAKAENDDLQRVSEALVEMVLTNPLTKLPNRVKFDEELTQREADNKRFAVAVIDLKDFKAINDEFGHATGDTVLQQAAQVIMLSVSEMGTRGEDFVAHFHGDEFAVIIDLEPHPTTSSTPDEAADLNPEARAEAARFNIATKISEYARLMKYDQLGLDASIGIAVHNPGDDVIETVNTADKRMFEHKRLQQEETGRYRS